MSRLSHIPPQVIGAPVVRGLPSPNVPNEPFYDFGQVDFPEIGTGWDGTQDVVLSRSVGGHTASGGWLRGGVSGPMKGGTRIVSTDQAGGNSNVLRLYSINADGTHTLLNSYPYGTADFPASHPSDQRYANIIALTDDVFVMVVGYYGSSTANYITWSGFKIVDDVIVSLNQKGAYTVGASTSQYSTGGTGVRLRNGYGLLVTSMYLSGGVPATGEAISFKYDGTTLTSGRNQFFYFNSVYSASVLSWSVRVSPLGSDRAIVSFLYYRSDTALYYPMAYEIVVNPDLTFQVSQITLPGTWVGFSTSVAYWLTPLSSTRFIARYGATMYVMEYTGTSLAVLGSIVAPTVTPAVGNVIAWHATRVNESEFFLTNYDNVSTPSRIHQVLHKLNSDDTVSVLSALDISYTPSNLGVSYHVDSAAYPISPDRLMLITRSQTQDIMTEIRRT